MRDVGVLDVEHLAQQKRRAFLGREPLERGEKRDGEVRCQIRSLVRTWQRFGDERFRQPRSRIRLALGTQRSQPVDAQAALSS